MCHVRTRSKREASSQNLTRKTSHMLNIPYNFLNGFELISKMTRGTSQSAEIRRLAEKSHACNLLYSVTEKLRTQNKAYSENQTVYSLCPVLGAPMKLLRQLQAHKQCKLSKIRAGKTNRKKYSTVLYSMPVLRVFHLKQKTKQKNQCSKMSSQKKLSHCFMYQHQYHEILAASVQIDLLLYLFAMHK